MNEMDFLVAQLKAKYGEVYQVEIEDEVFFFRLLTRREFIEIAMLGQDQQLKDELVCQMAVVWPEGLNFAQMPAGFAQTLCPIIVNESGFGEVPKADMYLEFYQKSMNQLDMQVEAVIQSAFPQITEEEMRDWTLDKLMRMAAKAEYILREIKGYDVSFKKPEPTELEEPAEEKEPPTFKELGAQAREQGIDPMYYYRDYILAPRPFAEIPFIAGVDYWRR